ncbi:hypothetical protein B0T19DRAFT_124770 [Cercophora scortea]|uniref:Uncharacterized protein n=1 Tax=Cercophora scortea TaxID=314031 RepID=A0AAE0MIY7_9PEZI|nr:hypothetical protein B0T19DRAFT_124770 [Cercophora scortea]
MLTLRGHYTDHPPFQLVITYCLSSSPQTDRRTDRQRRPQPITPFPQPACVCACMRARFPPRILSVSVICPPVCQSSSPSPTPPTSTQTDQNTHIHASGHKQTSRRLLSSLPPTFPPTGSKETRKAAAGGSRRSEKHTCFLPATTERIPALLPNPSFLFLSLSACVVYVCGCKWAAVCLSAPRPARHWQAQGKRKVSARYHAGADGEGRRIGRLQHRFSRPQY